MTLRRMAAIEGDAVAAYVHNAAADGLGKIGVLVALKGADNGIGKQIAMHIAATAPLSLSEATMDAAVVERELAVQTAKALEENATSAKPKPEKGLNFPDSELAIPALTEKDIADLAFAAHNADMLGFSFVQSAEDVAELQTTLQTLRPGDWDKLGLVLKIETAKAVRNLPDILVRSGAKQPTSLMIARGDLAIELGFNRMAEMQEEILWIGEAAQVPVIWATQVRRTFCSGRRVFRLTLNLSITGPRIPRETRNPE
jgi:pyruvate kinase